MCIRDRVVVVVCVCVCGVCVCVSGCVHECVHVQNNSSTCAPQIHTMADSRMSQAGVAKPRTVYFYIIITIIIIITYIYNALNDALSTYIIHNKLKTILSKYIHIQNRQSWCTYSPTYI